MGDTSTGYVYKRVPNVVSVENDPEWWHTMIAKLPPRQGYIPMLHYLGTEIRKPTPSNMVPPKELEKARRYYEHLRAWVVGMPGPRILFIDQFASMRELSFSVLFDVFDAVVIHDAECAKYTYPTPPGSQRYRFTMVRIGTDFFLPSAMDAQPLLEKIEKIAGTIEQPADIVQLGWSTHRL